MSTVLLNLGTLVFLAGCIIEVVFIAHYISVAPAFKSLIGVMFVLRSVSFLLAGTAILAGRAWGPDYAARPYLTFGLFIVVFVSAVITYTAFLFERYFRNKAGGWHFPFAAHLRMAGPLAWIKARLRRRDRDDDQDGGGSRLRAVERRSA